MKICFLTNTMNINSGYGRYSREIIERVNKFAEIVILTEEGSGYHGEITILKQAAHLKNIFKLAKEIKKYTTNCDIIHAMDVYPYGVIGALAKTREQKLVMSAHGTYAVPHSTRNPLKFFGSFIKKKIMLMAYEKAVSVVAVSHYTREQILKFSKKNNVIVINNGIDFSRFSKIEKIAHRGKIVLSVGLIKERKGYHISILAIVEAKKVIPDLKYKIIGGIANPIYFEKLKKIVEELGLGGTVEFLQNISDSELLDEYATADLFVLSSVNVKNSFEGFGLVFLEAAAAGVPVVGTKNNGIEDAVKDGYNGILVPQNDIGKTAEAIIKILSDGNLSSRFSENGRIWASEHTWDEVIKEYQKIYQKSS